MSSITFSPLLPDALIIVSIILAAGLAIFLIAQGARGAYWRTLVLAIAVAALANPTWVQEQRKTLPDVAVVLVDETASQNIADRSSITATALSKVRNRLAQHDGLEVREISIGSLSEDGSKAFNALDQAMSDVPPDRLAGTILITDGQIHDVPEFGEDQDDASLPAAFGRPLHVFLTGRQGERDRRLIIEQTPRYGIVGESISVELRVDDPGHEGEPARVTARIDGGEAESSMVQIGETTTLRLNLAHGGETALELEVEPGEDELTLDNNRSLVLVNGVRDRLRVMLVSGEPSQGLRTWRNLLKADPSVDLVHFTILRPPNKQDVTPVKELSLIPFPSGELFATNLAEFDLIIFDRYHRRGILPMMYLGNVVSYVLRGGAILDTAGPAFATPLSLAKTPLGTILPGVPTGEVLEQGFLPELTVDGRRHPVTAGLQGAVGPSGEGGPTWGRWFRLIGADVDRGTTLIRGVEDRPVLVLERIGEGRVAQLLSDQSWLWARGFEGGGPQADLLRRLVHWLMKEPDLEEEALTATVNQQTIVISRQSLDPVGDPVIVNQPDGETVTIELTDDGNGQASAEFPADQIGLYRLTQGDHTAIAVVGIANPIEMSDVRATADHLETVAETTGGTVTWVATQNAPDIRMVEAGRDTFGRGWVGLIENNRYTVTGLNQLPLLPAIVLLLLLVGGLLAAWRAEGR